VIAATSALKAANIDPALIDSVCIGNVLAKYGDKFKIGITGFRINFP
jgi:hypothetical protein